MKDVIRVELTLEDGGGVCWIGPWEKEALDVWVKDMQQYLKSKGDPMEYKRVDALMFAMHEGIKALKKENSRRKGSAGSPKG